MVERKVMMVCMVVGSLGLLSVILSFSAEMSRVKITDVHKTKPGQCIYPKSPALALGLAAAMVLMFAHSIINTFAGCICCKKYPNHSVAKWTIALISFIISWVTFILAFFVLLMGSALNDLQRGQSEYNGDYCYVVMPGVFSTGALLSIATISLEILYYVVLLTPKNVPLQNPENKMGRPQVPLVSAQPVFVHENSV